MHGETVKFKGEDVSNRGNVTLTAFCVSHCATYKM